MQQRLIDLTSARHKKFGHTIFHLEPNIKDSPGGLRDYQVACWLGLISELEKTGVWPAPENLLPERVSRGVRRGAGFSFGGAMLPALSPRPGLEWIDL